MKDLKENLKENYIKILQQNKSYLLQLNLNRCIEIITGKAIKQLTREEKAMLYEAMKNFHPELCEKHSLKKHLNILGEKKEIEEKIEKNEKKEEKKEKKEKKEKQIRQNILSQLSSNSTLEEIENVLLNMNRVYSSSTLYKELTNKKIKNDILTLIKHKITYNYPQQMIADNVGGTASCYDKIFRGEFYPEKLKEQIDLLKIFVSNYDKNIERLASADKNEDVDLLLQPLTVLNVPLSQKTLQKFNDNNIYTIEDFIVFSSKAKDDIKKQYKKGEYTNLIKILEKYNLKRLYKKLEKFDEVRTELVTLKITGDNQQVKYVKHSLLKHMKFINVPIDIEIKNIEDPTIKNIDNLEGDWWELRYNLVTNEQTGKIDTKKFNNTEDLGDYLISIGEKVKKLKSIKDFPKSELFSMKY